MYAEVKKIVCARMSRITVDIKIESLLRWSSPRRLKTNRGFAILRTASPTERFWKIWSAQKDVLKSQGISVRKNQTTWEVCWWQNDLQDDIESKNAIEASRATSAEIEIPAPL